jgi:hypothetical protein
MLVQFGKSHPHVLMATTRIAAVQLMIYGSLRLLPAVGRAPGLLGSPEVWGARLVSGEYSSMHMLSSVCGRGRLQRPPPWLESDRRVWVCRAAKALGI